MDLNFSTPNLLLKSFEIKPLWDKLERSHVHRSETGVFAKVSRSLKIGEFQVRTILYIIF